MAPGPVPGLARCASTCPVPPDSSAAPCPPAGWKGRLISAHSTDSSPATFTAPAAAGGPAPTPKSHPDPQLRTCLRRNGPGCSVQHPKSKDIHNSSDRASPPSPRLNSQLLHEQS